MRYLGPDINLDTIVSICPACDMKLTGIKSASEHIVGKCRVSIRFSNRNLIYQMPDGVHKLYGQTTFSNEEKAALAILPIGTAGTLRSARPLLHYMTWGRPETAALYTGLSAVVSRQIIAKCLYRALEFPDRGAALMTILSFTPEEDRNKIAFEFANGLLLP